MKASLVSREVIADSIELVSFAEGFDGLVVVAGCDKNMPGTMMAAARLNIPAIHVFGARSCPVNSGGGTSTFRTCSRRWGLFQGEHRW